METIIMNLRLINQELYTTSTDTYLIDKGVTQADVKEVISCVDGRLVDLQSSLKLIMIMNGQ